MGKMQSHRFNKYRSRQGFCFNFCNFKTQRIEQLQVLKQYLKTVTFCIVYSTDLSLQPPEEFQEVLLSLSYLPSAERLTVVLLKARNLFRPLNKESIGQFYLITSSLQRSLSLIFQMLELSIDSQNIFDLISFFRSIIARGFARPSFSVMLCSESFSNHYFSTLPQQPLIQNVLQGCLLCGLIWIKRKQLVVL